MKGLILGFRDYSTVDSNSGLVRILSLSLRSKQHIFFITVWPRFISALLMLVPLIFLIPLQLNISITEPNSPIASAKRPQHYGICSSAL